VKKIEKFDVVEQIFQTQTIHRWLTQLRATKKLTQPVDPDPSQVEFAHRY